MGSSIQGGQIKQPQAFMSPQQSQQGKGPGLPTSQQQMGGNRPYEPVGANNGPFNPSSVQPVNQPLQVNNGVNNPNFNPLQNNPQLDQLLNNPHLSNAIQKNPNIARFQAAKGAAQSSQPVQQGSEYGQYGNNPINQSSPFSMNLNATENKRVNDYNAATNIPSPQLPANIPNQGATWYPGMYPTNQPQFGTNAYSPQTFNIQGHPGDGHNPLGAGSVMTNQAMNNQGQIVKQMATGGTSNLFSSLMPKTASASTIEPVVVNKFSPSQEAITHPSTVPSIQNLSLGKGMRRPFPGVFGIYGNLSNNWSNAFLPQFGKGPAEVTPEPEAPPPPPQQRGQVYQPKYEPIKKIETDAYGNPLFNSGGSTDISFAAGGTSQPMMENKFSPSQQTVMYPNSLPQNNQQVNGSTVFKQLRELYPGVFTGQQTGPSPNILNNFNFDPRTMNQNVYDIVKKYMDNHPTPTPSTAPPAPTPQAQVYQPTYEPIKKIETDEYGNPLYASGGTVTGMASGGNSYDPIFGTSFANNSGFMGSDNRPNYNFNPIPAPNQAEVQTAPMVPRVNMSGLPAITHNAYKPSYIDYNANYTDPFK